MKIAQNSCSKNTNMIIYSSYTFKIKLVFFQSENFAWDSIGKVKECSISGEKIEVNTFLDQRFTEIKPFIHQFIEDSTLVSIDAY